MSQLEKALKIATDLLSKEGDYHKRKALKEQVKILKDLVAGQEERESYSSQNLWYNPHIPDHRD